MKPGELASGVDDQGNVLGRSANSERDSEAHVVVKGKLVWGSRDGPRWNDLGFEGQNKRRCLRGAKCSVKNKKRERFEKCDWDQGIAFAGHKVKVGFHGVFEVKSFRWNIG